LDQDHQGSSTGKQADLGGTADDLLRKGADKAIESGLGGWWQQRNDNEKLATGLIAFGVAIGPLGLGLLGALGALFKDAIPSSQQLEGVFWLLLITAPLAAFCIVVVWVAGKHGPLPGALGAAAIAAVVVSALLSQSSVPNELAGLYCYAEVDGGGIAYESQCREFNHAGFVAENQSRASPTGAAAVFGSALVYTVDARGSIMAFAAIMVSIGVGLLFREHS
jgi:hypothetical protein